MNPKSFFTLAIVLVGALGFLRGASAQSASEAEREQVRQIANGWLALVDGGKDSATWHALSPSASAKVNQSKWQSAFNEKRQQFGVPKGRSFKAQHLFVKGQNGNRQDFYLVEFHSVSAERGALRELVRVVKDADGQWRVAGYDIEQRHPGAEEEGENEEAD